MRAREETWPWVWCQPNPNGPHHVFVGCDASLLGRARALMLESPQNNLTIVVDSADSLAKLAPLEQFFEAGCAVVEGEVVQLEAKDRVMMLGDERIICFDKCHIL